jgi:hypothetical protein
METKESDVGEVQSEDRFTRVKVKSDLRLSRANITFQSSLLFQLSPQSIFCLCSSQNFLFENGCLQPLIYLLINT